MFGSCCTAPAVLEDAAEPPPALASPALPEPAAPEAPDAPAEATPQASPQAAARAAAAEGAAPSAPEGEPAAAPTRRRVALRVALRGADLLRSFSKLGRLDPMDPYAVVEFGGKEVHRTAPSFRAHKKPAWDADFTVVCGDGGHPLSVHVWDRNRFHRHVLCGTAAVPCSGTAGLIDFKLLKKGRPSGHVRLSVSEVFEEEPAVAPAPTPAPPAGDHAADQEERRPEAEPPAPEAAAPEQAAPEEAAPAAAPCLELLGKWTCVDTWGMEDFLKAQKRSFFERKIALSARWPEWEFKRDGEEIVFLNLTQMGLLTERIVIGREYESVDGQKNQWKVNASWAPAEAGGCLVQERAGAQGCFKEERTVNGDKLDFVLTRDGTSWGRSFVRA